MHGVQTMGALPVSEMVGARKRSMRGKHWLPWNFREMDLQEMSALLDWYEMHSHTLWHRVFSRFGTDRLECSNASGIGTNFVFWCACGADFDATNYGSW